ncbi:50S ribosomal protein L25 [bacterium]|nr:50S ribosomal protein L25 [bacterium]NBX48851.1 50S ribosomal protein L25 [bacterium]
MQHATIDAQKREITGRATDALRAAGSVPAVMYGFGTEPMNIVVDRNAFVKVYAQAGESTVVSLTIDGVVHPVLIADVQRDPLTDFFTHIDFRRVDRSKKIEANIRIALVGESSAVKNLGGTLIQSLEELEVFALPDKLVSEIEVDIAKLATFYDVVRVSDIVVPEGIEVKNDAETAIASVQAPRSEEELAALNEAVDFDVSKVEVLTEKKDEESEGENEKK